MDRLGHNPDAVVGGSDSVVGYLEHGVDVDTILLSQSVVSGMLDKALNIYNSSIIR